MARVYDAENIPLDFCRVHFPKDEAAAIRRYGEGVDYDCAHPPYDECEDYTCESCNRLLTNRDNGVT